MEDTQSVFDKLPASSPIDKETWACLMEAFKLLLSTNFDLQSKLDASVKEYFSKLDDRVETLEKDVQEIKNEDLKGKISSIEKSLKSYSDCVKKVQLQTLPSLADHLNCAVTALAINNIDINAHRRKFTLVAQGIPGKAGESADETRKKLCSTVSKALEIDVSPSDFAACHRLDSSKPNSGIHARFVDLSKRDLWLANAKKLAKLDKKDTFSLSVDVPPCLRKVRKELADVRKGLPSEKKKQSYIKHLPSYPYFELVIKGEETRRHTWSKQEIALQSLPTMLAECASLNYEIPVKELPSPEPKPD